MKKAMTVTAALAAAILGTVAFAACNNTTKPLPTTLSFAGDLQALYGEGGYPQAAVVVKKSVIAERKDDLLTFIGYLNDAKTYLETAEISEILGHLDANREEGLTPSFSDKNLTREVVARCSVRFSSGELCKTKVEEFLEKLIMVNSESTAIPSEEFYYLG